MGSGEATKYEAVSKAVVNILISTVEKFTRIAKCEMILTIISKVNERHCPNNVMTLVFCLFCNVSVNGQG